MPTHTFTDDAIPDAPVIPSAEQIFDRIMGRIDPRFTLSGQKVMQEQLKTATDEEKKVLMEAFNTALARYDKEAKMYFELLGDYVRSYCGYAEALEEEAEQDDAEKIFS